MKNIFKTIFWIVIIFLIIGYCGNDELITLQQINYLPH